MPNLLRSALGPPYIQPRRSLKERVHLETFKLSYDELLKYRKKTAFLSSREESPGRAMDQLSSYRNFTLQDSLKEADEAVLRECNEKAGLASADVNFLTDVIPAIRDGRDSPDPMLIEGETGTGKEMVVNCLHETSSKYETCVKVNCAAIPESLVESELFGHTKGAFTGAGDAREGKFKAADGGIIFLDEIGELPKHVQAKLLRVLNDGSIEPVGSDNSNDSVTVKVIAASNRNLSDMVCDGTFRKDLFYRFSGITVRLLPLFLRPGDLLPLLFATIRQYEKDTGTYIETLTDWVIYELFTHRWPGNVRELVGKVRTACGFFGTAEYIHSLGCQREIERGPLSVPVPDPRYYPVAEAIDVVEEVMTRFDGLLPAEQRGHWRFESRLERYAREISASATPRGSILGKLGSTPTGAVGPDRLQKLVDIEDHREALAAFKCEYISSHLTKHGGSKAKTAKALGLSPNTITNILRAGKPRNEQEGHNASR